jgi:3-hydroxyisobutyrate dehydrogenase-like beta-hydroxyacid dehydrogenase
MATIAIVAAGAMGAAVGKRLTVCTHCVVMWSYLFNAFQQHGCKVLTHLQGRSDATRKRAGDAGMQDASFVDIGKEAEFVLSILPPSDAFAFARQFLDEAGGGVNPGLTFVDCNAVNPKTVKSIAALFASAKRPVPFVDASIIGGPPSEGYDPTFYASADDGDALNRFDALSQHGLKISILKGDGVGTGDASALKMSYAVECIYMTCPFFLFFAMVI